VDFVVCQQATKLRPKNITSITEPFSYQEKTYANP